MHTPTIIATANNIIAKYYHHASFSWIPVTMISKDSYDIQMKSSENMAEIDPAPIGDILTFPYSEQALLSGVHDISIGNIQVCILGDVVIMSSEYAAWLVDVSLKV